MSMPKGLKIKKKKKNDPSLAGWLAQTWFCLSAACWGGEKGRGDPCSVLSLYVRRVVNQTDVCDVISLCKIRAVLISVFLLVARPNCFVVNVLLYEK